LIKKEETHLGLRKPLITDTKKAYLLVWSTWTSKSLSNQCRSRYKRWIGSINRDLVAEVISSVMSQRRNSIESKRLDHNQLHIREMDHLNIWRIQ